jgi:hypothetical protein
MRLTTTSFAADGHVTRQSQKFVSIAGGFEISEPQSSADFPKLWDYRRLDLLPFHSLLNK